jgi:hypothetical protein
MRMDPNSSIEQLDDLMPVENHRQNLKPDPEDQSWSFLPVIVASAVACLLLYLFLMPTSYNADAPIAHSARPGAATQATPAKPEHGRRIGNAHP